MTQPWNALGVQNFYRHARLRYGRGRIVISGACAEPTPIEPVTALLKELSIRYSVCYTPDEFYKVIARFDGGVVDPAPIVGPVLGLNRIAEAFDLVRAARVHGRVLVRPE
jgi:(R,R)-butanediol dehydrogenase / meso-butanediol dehydrogenase / diacetyl reductase